MISFDSSTNVIEVTSFLTFALDHCFRASLTRETQNKAGLLFRSPSGWKLSTELEWIASNLLQSRFPFALVIVTSHLRTPLRRSVRPSANTAGEIGMLQDHLAG